jgi:hypothetical protein
MDRIILSEAQLAVMSKKLKQSGKLVIVIENVNVENTVACSLDGGKFLVDHKGRIFDMSTSS